VEDSKIKMLRIDQNDMETNSLERVLGEWAVAFGKRVADKYCI
jgi:hypothetical protein